MLIFKHIHKNFEDDIESDVEYTVYGDPDIHRVMQEFRRFLLAVSFQPATIDKYIEAE